MLRQTLNSLPPEKRGALMEAFQRGDSYYVLLAERRFIGVNVSKLPNLTIDEELGPWAIGKVC